MTAPMPPASYPAAPAAPSPTAIAQREEGARPFGAHLRMSWWKPVVLLVGLPLVMIALQVALYQVVGVIEQSEDPMSPTFTPLKLLAINLSIALTGLLAVALVARFAHVRWRHVLSSRRRFDGRRLAWYLGVSALLVGAGLGVTALVAPGSTGWTGFAVSTTTVGLLVVTLITTPLQAAGEELMFRGAIMPAAASWVRATRPALVLGVIVSSALFGAVHGSTDPWLLGYYVVIGVSTAMMATLSRGLEAPIAFHVANNLVAAVLNAVMAGGGVVTEDRANETGGPSLLILVVMNVVAVVVVRRRERALSARTSPTTTGVTGP